MSEYITIDMEPTDDPGVVIFHTNLNLAPDGVEDYPDRTRGEAGSPLAQAIFVIEGILALTLSGSDLIITWDGELELFHLADELDAALKDFFL